MTHKKTNSDKNEELIIESPWCTASDNQWHINFGKLAMGIALIIIGLLYLANNLGWVPVEINFKLWQLWPLLIIFWGLSLISGRGLLSIVAGGILTFTVLIIAGTLISNQLFLDLEPELTQLNTLPLSQAENLMKSYPIDFSVEPDIDEIYLDIDNQLGNLIIKPENNKLVSGQLKSNYSKLTINSQKNDTAKAIYLKSTVNSSKIDQNQSNLELLINDKIPTNIKITSGASRIEADLKNVVLSTLTIISSGSSAFIELGNTNNETTVKLNGHYSKLVIKAPKDRGIAIKGIEKLTGFQKSGSKLISDNFTSATNYINLEFDSAPNDFTISYH